MYAAIVAILVLPNPQIPQPSTAENARRVSPGTRNVLMWYRIGAMPPQPLSKIVREPTYDLTPDRIEERPELAVLVPKAIAISAVIETQWGRLLAGMLGANAAPVIAMYQALSNASAQRHALEAAAKRLISPEHKELFDALVLIARSLAKERNRLAHGGW